MASFLGYSSGGYSHRGGRGGSDTIRGQNGKSFRASNTGKHKWIRTAQQGVITATSNNKDEANKPQSTTSRINDGVNALDVCVKSTTVDIPENNKLDDIAASKYNIMKKNGRNQLILFASAGSSSEISNESKVARQTLTRDGRHKLISTSNDNKDNSKRSTDTYRRSIRSQRSYCSVSDAKRKNFSAFSHPVVKRVKLPAKNTGTECSVVGSNRQTEDASFKQKRQRFNSTEEEEESGKQQPPDKDITSIHQSGKLTDFAYRQTNRVKKQHIDTASRNLRWSKNETKSNNSKKTKPNEPIHNNKQQSMGLVRVQPDETRTPICPTFLRGIQCQDQYCRKRHDVPKEFAVPICSFFQRHGQCLRGESCIFRHVRNPICPYCKKRHDPSKEFCSYFKMT